MNDNITVAQLIVVEYNTRRNAYEGKRNKAQLISLESVKLIKDTIVTWLNRIKSGYVLVRYNGRTFLCEKNNVNPELDYLRHETPYNPLDKLFTI